MMAERNRHLPDPDQRVVPRIWNLGPDEVGYHRIEGLRQDGRPLSFEVNDTVMRVPLAEPLAPGDSAVFELVFHSQVPLQTRRSGRDSREGVDYSMTQWYPKLAAYDSRGWHADPYVGREFYAPYGTFDVRLTLPADYVVGATGTLRNPGEVGHGYGEAAPAAASAPPDSLTWHFHAEGVHDFAWVADPDYLHDRFEGDGVTYHLLYLPDVAAAWKTMRDWVPALLRFYSEQYGAYPYPRFTVAQGGDGAMEYPMLVLLTGRRSPGSLQSVTAHEAAHQWFYGLLGSNEADYAWMDEGLASYIQAEALAALQGRQNPGHGGSAFAVVSLHEAGLAERLGTPADWFETNAAYGTTAYSGGRMIAALLGYVISEPLRDAWLRAYYRRFRFRHPNPYDLEKVAEDVSGLQLDWYFEQFANTTWTLDYAVAGLDARRSGAGWTATVDLRRRGEAVLPVDLRLTLEDGSVQWVNVPLGLMEGHKPVPEGWIVAAPWPWTSPAYRLEVSLPQKAVKAEIDPLGLTPERNRLNDASRLPVRVRFLRAPEPTWFAYGVGYRPVAGYAHAFGPGVGVQARGGYVFERHRLQAMLKLWPRVLFSGGDAPRLAGGPAPQSTAFDGLDYELAYATRVPAFGPGTTAALSLQKHLGVLENVVSLDKRLSGYRSAAARHLTLSLLHQQVPSDRTFLAGAAPLAPALRPLGRGQAISARLAYEVARGRDRLAFAVEAGSALAGGASAVKGELEAAKAAGLGPLHGRARLKFGLGSRPLLLHKAFRLGAASLEEAWRHDAFRSVAALFEDPAGDVHLAALGAPGPVAYLLADAPVPAAGRNVLAGSLSLSTGPLARHPWLAPLRAEAFSGLGTLWNTASLTDAFDPGDYLADAGLGLSYDAAQVEALRRWTAQSDVLSGLRLAARFPLWVSDPDLLGEDDAFGFRWLLGVVVGP
jgi:hypothetical protein